MIYSTDLFYSNDIDETKIRKHGFTDNQIIIKVYTNNFINARQELGLMEYDIEHKKRIQQIFKIVFFIFLSWSI